MASRNRIIPEQPLAAEAPSNNLRRFSVCHGNRFWKCCENMVPAAVMTGPPGPVTIFDGDEYLYFGGTSYLGLAGHPEVIKAGCDALRAHGVHTATSRSRLGTNPPLLAVEENAARFFGTEDAFYFGSGYVGNHIMVAALAEGVDTVFVDAAAHYCVLEAARLAGKPVQYFPHRDAEALRDAVGENSRVLVMADAVAPSSGRVAPIAEYIEALQDCNRARILLDDAHGFGVLGTDGRGLLDKAGRWHQANRGLRQEGVSLYVCGTLAKALGGFGGIIPGTAEFLLQLRSTSHYYDGSSAPPSPVAGASAKALEIVMRDPTLRTRLHENSQRLRTGLQALGLEVPTGDTAHFGVTIGSAAKMMEIHRQLRQRRIMLPYVPTYTGIPAEGILRFAIFANHTSSQIDHLLTEVSRLL
jgi:8-amino-7-oxononanoate synthase